MSPADGICKSIHMLFLGVKSTTKGMLKDTQYYMEALVTLALIFNIALSLVVLIAVLSVAAWAVVHSHHEGRPVAVAARRRRWMRHTVSLRRGSSASSRPLARPFAS
jgi:hypothetical protein